jgi:hypothetical protein
MINSIFAIFFPDSSDALVSRSNALLASRSSQVPGAAAREVNLPQEWTY